MPPVIDRSKCTACQVCATVCCMDVFGPAVPKKIPVVTYPDECWHCRACAMDCPTGAISMRYPLTHTLLYREGFDPGKEDNIL